MIDYPSMIQSDSLILFIDFFKAFNTMKHEYIFSVLRKVGFGEGFCKVIKMLDNNIYSYFSLNPGMTPRIEISPKLFILLTQMLAYLIVNQPQLKGITFFAYEYWICWWHSNIYYIYNYKQVYNWASLYLIFFKSIGPMPK